MPDIPKCKFGDERETLLEYVQKYRKRTLTKRVLTFTGLPQGEFKEFLWCGVPEPCEEILVGDANGRTVFRDTSNGPDRGKDHLIETMPEDSPFSMAWGPIEVDLWDQQADILHNWRDREEIQPTTFPMQISFGEGCLDIPAIIDAVLRLTDDPEFGEAVREDVSQFMRHMYSVSQGRSSLSEEDRKAARMVLSEVLPREYKNPKEQKDSGWRTRAINAISQFNSCFGLEVSDDNIQKLVNLYPEAIVQMLDEQLRAGHSPLVPQWAGWSKFQFHGGLGNPCAGSDIVTEAGGRVEQTVEKKLLTSVTSVFSTTHGYGYPSVLVDTPPDEWMAAYEAAHTWLMGQEMGNSDLTLEAARKVPFWFVAENEEDSRLSIITSIEHSPGNDIGLKHKIKCGEYNGEETRSETESRAEVPS